MNVSSVTLDIVDGMDLPDEFLAQLRSFAYGSGGHGVEGGYSYLVKRSYLESWYDDCLEGDDCPHELKELLTKTKTSFIIIAFDGDDLFTAY